MSTIGIPIKILHEAEMHVITCELKTGDVFRGQLVEAEDNMNIQMRNIVVTSKDGKQSKLEYAFVRGSKIRWFILPDMLKNAPMFARDNTKIRGLGAGIQGMGGPGGRGRGRR